MTTTLIVLNDAPYGSEHSYNGLRLAGALAGREDSRVLLFLMGDGAGCAKSGQRVPQGYYNVEIMVRSVLRHGGDVGVCGSCMDARGLRPEELMEGARRSSLDELATWVLQADRTLVF